MKGVKVRPKDLEKVRVAILRMQGGKCPLCLEAIRPGKKKPATDHDHFTGYIREVLCLYCNGMLGKVENSSRKAVGKGGDSLAWLKRVLKYLELHDTPQWSVKGVRTGLIYPTHKTAEDKRLMRLEKAKLKRNTAKALRNVK